MCGIFGYTGKRKRNVVETALKGLKRLEYRGYDSAGIAGIKSGLLQSCKEVGKVSSLEKQVQEVHLDLDVAIAHTRWATHGLPNYINAHPHFNASQSLALVHNGIIENYLELKLSLQNQGVQFLSSTDTEVIAHLIESCYQGNILEALQQAVFQLKGAYAIALVHKDYPDSIYAIAHESPLAIGLSDNEVFIASDSSAFAEYTKDVIFLANSEIAEVHPTHYQIFDFLKNPITKSIEKLAFSSEDCSKGNYEHYTLKEIHEQPLTTKNAMIGRLSEELGNAVFEETEGKELNWQEIERITILACGSSWHAGYIASYFIEEQAKIPVKVEISSEFRYKNPLILPGTLTIAISQSGETADTIAAMRSAKAKGSKILAICNVLNSTLAREADATIFLRAGPEIGVCSTKAFTNQLVILILIALKLSREHDMTQAEGQNFVKALKNLPMQIQEILDQSTIIYQIAKKYALFENFFFLGRHSLFPTALEGALKLKEISYINANGYPAGELKHGPIALVNEDCPTVALCANETTFTKLLSNLMEVKARKGPIITIATSVQDTSSVADDSIIIPQTIDPLSPLLVTIATQLFAYYVAKERNTEIDQPRNLAKSVTVE